MRSLLLFCFLFSAPFVLTAQPPAVLAADQLSNSEVCAGATVSLPPFTGTAGSWTWTNTNQLIGLAAAGTGNIPAFVAMNSGSSNLRATITVLPALVPPGASARPMRFQITVKPMPSIVAPASQVLCAEASTMPVLFTGALPGTTYSWINDNTTTGLPATGAGNIASFVAHDPTAVPAVSNITVTPLLHGCAGVAASLAITVHPSVAALNYPNSSLLCATGRVRPLLTGSKGGTFSAVWPGPAPVIDPLTGEIDLAVSGDVMNVVSYQLPASTAGCQTSMTTLVRIFGTPSVDPVPNKVYCRLQAVPGGIHFNTHGAAGGLRWEASAPWVGLPSFSGLEDIPGFVANTTLPGATAIATVRVTPYSFPGCPGKTMVFRITVEPCGPLAQPGDVPSGDGSTLRSVSGLSVAPNPTTGVLHVSCPVREGLLRLMVLDASGTVLLDARRNADTPVTLYIGNLKAGVYLLRVASERNGMVWQATVVRQ